MQYEIKGSASFTTTGDRFWAAHKPRIFSNSVLRGGPRWRFSQENFQFFFVGSDQRKKFNGVVGMIHSQAKEDNFSLLKFESRLNYQPTNALNISLAPEYSISKSKTQYVTQSDYEVLGMFWERLTIIHSQPRCGLITPSTLIYQFNIMDNLLFHVVVTRILNM